MEKSALKLRLKRIRKEEGFTVGVLHVGNKFVAHTLEPQWRDLHHEPYIRGDTAVPEGTYQVRLQLSPRHKCLMPYLTGTPAGFEEVVIQGGNFVSQCEGGILVGGKFDTDMLKNSRDTFGLLSIRLFAASSAEREIIISIK